MIVNCVVKHFYFVCKDCKNFNKLIIKTDNPNWERKTGPHKWTLRYDSVPRNLTDNW